jgi:hypothetical protein
MGARMNYRADSDIAAIFAGNSFSIPPELGPDEAFRLQEFLTCDQVLEGYYRRGERPSDAELRSSATAAMAVYDQRTEQLSVGWQKFAVLQAGIAGIDLEDREIIRWAHGICKGRDGWLGDFDVDITQERPLRTMVQEMPVSAFLDF